MENTINNTALYTVFSIDEDNNGDQFWNAEGATLYNAGVELARALNLPVDKAVIGDAPEGFALPISLGAALRTLFESCRGWYSDSQVAPHPVLAGNYYGAELSERFNLDDDEEEETSGDAEPQTDAETSGDADAEPQTDAEQEQEQEQSEEQEAQPSKQEPDCDKDEELKGRFFDAVNEYLDINEVDADDAEAETEALGFKFWALTSLERRAALDLTEEGYAALDESIDRARELDDLTDEAIDFYESIKADGATDEAIENAVDFDALESDEQELVKTLVEEGTDAEDAIRHASCGDYWKMVDASRLNCDTNTALADAYIESVGGVDQLSRDVLERYFDYADFGRDLRFDLDLIETESGDIYLR